MVSVVTRSDLLRVNFTISEAAKAAIEQVRRDYVAAFPDDPPAVLAIAWGSVSPDSGGRFERVVVSYYQRSLLAEVADGIQEVSGLKFIYFTTPQYHRNFEGKVLDHSEAAGFFLRAP